uniref:Protein-arginine kinase n=1 Tax=candidate division WOR-3 bacterium TaxID=2052148 RepID=A0A7C3URK3_UNCW3
MGKNILPEGNTVGKWFLPEGPNSDIVLSSRIRLARNLAGIPFLPRAEPKDQEKVLEMVKEALNEQRFLEEGYFLTENELSPLKLEFLKERHLIPLDFVRSERKRGIYIKRDETESILINEEDHLRLQSLTSGMDLFSAYEKIENLDNTLSEELPYAFTPEFGYLTTCPTNVGTGLRASLFLHLPGLVITKEIEKVLRSLLEMGLVARGIYGEGSETKGNLFQVSNQITLGLSEEEILEKVTKVGEQIVEYEKKAREFLMRDFRLAIEDKIARAYAILKNARLLNSEEATNLLLLVRLGINLNLIKEVDLKTINILLILIRPANLQIYYNQEMEERERDEKRASLVRSVLSNG